MIAAVQSEPRWLLALVVPALLLVAFAYLWASDVLEAKFARRGRPAEPTAAGSGRRLRHRPGVDGDRTI